eukprot:CAMPEP_0176215154 /NCGR_PEP_ID=MMETSP0121_2-20121125/16535_1 /TAXON_ID=160619 /ORGANISM="Kryptoperidinium foliaceum, Strain CCMP 1326" /LENGTH=219 /DNA_ID=CAMNT_0017554253 /DNA_START=280 /DNA_END=934 /DNA_ORIENTATION=+
MAAVAQDANVAPLLQAIFARGSVATRPPPSGPTADASTARKCGNKGVRVAAALSRQRRRRPDGAVARGLRGPACGAGGGPCHRVYLCREVVHRTARAHREVRQDDRAGLAAEGLEEWSGDRLLLLGRGGCKREHRRQAQHHRAEGEGAEDGEQDALQRGEQKHGLEFSMGHITGERRGSPGRPPAPEAHGLVAAGGVLRHQDVAPERRLGARRAAPGGG